MRKVFIPLAVVILLVAATLRIAQLKTYPPGPHYDEAANILITRSIAFGGANLFPIANSYQGRESLYFYWNVPFFRFIGDDVFVMRLSSVFANLLTIAASMALGRAMLRGNRGVFIGLATGVLMTISFHQIFMSRQAYRAVMLPFMQALGLLFLWRGLNTSRRDWLWLILGGIFSAGALYTYMASRLFPVWLALGGLALLVADRIHWQYRWRQGLIFFGALAVASVPLVIYALQNPDIFFQRLTEVSDGAVTVTLIRKHPPSSGDVLHSRGFWQSALQHTGTPLFHAAGRDSLVGRHCDFSVAIITSRSTNRTCGLFPDSIVSADGHPQCDFSGRIPAESYALPGDGSLDFSAGRSWF